MRKLGRLPLDQLQPYLIATTAPGPSGSAGPAAGPLDFASLFGNTNPVELEVGHGKGQFIVSSASARPEVNFLGIEIVYKYHLYTADRAARRRLTNVRLVCGDVRELLPRLIPPASLQAIHVYFPDPWWKTRHHKRRVFTPTFVAHCVTALRPHGHLCIATDVAEYAQMIREMCAAQPELCDQSAPMADVAFRLPELQTNFERKAQLQGRPIFRMLYQRSEPLPSLPDRSTPEA